MSTKLRHGIVLTQGRRIFVAGLLEMVASERLDFLGPFIEVLEHSPAGRGLLEVAEVWGIPPEGRATGLGVVAARAAKHLSRLERRRTGWRHPKEIVDAPNVNALVDFADARSSRIDGVARARRLEVLGRKLKRAADVERQRQQLDAFLREKPAQPVNLAAFMGWSADD